MSLASLGDGPSGEGRYEGADGQDPSLQSETAQAPARPQGPSGAVCEAANELARGVGFHAPGNPADRVGEHGLYCRPARCDPRARLPVERTAGDRRTLHPLRTGPRILLRGGWRHVQAGRYQRPRGGRGHGGAECGMPGRGGAGRSIDQGTARLAQPRTFSHDRPAGRTTDRYGRALRSVVRLRPDGSEDRLADYMQREGGARGYWGGFRDGWC